MPTALGTIASHRTAPTGGGGPPMTGLLGWWDSDDATTFTYASGNFVNQWNDKSSAAAHATQTLGGGYYPTRVASAINGRAAVNFDGTANYMQVSGLSAAQKPFTVVSVQTITSWDYRSIWGNLVTGGLQIRSNPSQKVEIMASSQALMGTSTSNLPAVAAVLVVTYSATGDWAIYINGVAAGTGTNDRTFPAGGTRFGTNQSASEKMYGYLAEMLKYDAVLSTVERQQVESYLKTKWGTP